MKHTFHLPVMASLACLLLLLAGCQTSREGKCHTPTVPVIMQSGHARRGSAQERQQLFQAAAEGDLQTVYRLVGSGIDINTKDKHGETALHIALAHSQYAVAQWLIRSGANPDIPYADPTWGTPMRELCQREKASPCLRSFDEWYAGRLETLRLMVTSHKDPNAGLPLHLTLEEDPDAFGLGKEDIVPMLLAAGVDVNRRDAHGKTPLEYACSNMQIIASDDMAHIPHMLLRAGANPNVMSTPRLCDFPYWTPLSNAIYAAGAESYRSKARKLVRALLAAGADPTIVEGDGKTALDRARESRDRGVRSMVEKRAAELAGGKR